MSGRSRSKKTKAVAEEPAAAAEAVASAEEPVKEKKTRKKQFPVVAVITPDGIEGNLMNTASRRPLIVHFPIQSKEILSNDMPVVYDPCPPTDAVPYDSHADNPFMDEVEQVDGVVGFSSGAAATSSASASASGSSSSGSGSSAAGSASASGSSATASASASGSSSTKLDFYKLKGTFLFQFKDASETKSLPESTDAACFWCCHSFSSRPVVLPLRDTGDHLIVMGNFCCPECAMAHLFDMHVDSHTRWEQMSLLHRVYGTMCGGKIRPAPPRSSLKLFGGMLTIQEYRALLQSYTVRIDIHLPPMVSILATMDTKPIDFYDAGLTKNVSETVKERLQKAEEVLRLRRTKPLKAWESTLDACINLKN